MVDLLKAFGRGILYVLAFPFFIVVLAIFAVVGLIAFLFQLIKSVIFFFTGQKFFPELPEDRELRLMKEAEEAKNNPAPAQTEQAQQPVPNNLIFEEVMDEPGFEEEPAPVISPIPTPAPTSVEEACFQDLGVKEVKEEPTPAPIPEPEIEPEIEEPLFEQINEEPETIEPEVGAPVEELLPHDDTDPMDDFLSALTEEEEVPAEELETYRPRGSEDSFQDEDNDDSHVGVYIRYDD